jgi:Fe-Mn family superoxide dismutase
MQNLTMLKILLLSPLAVAATAATAAGATYELPALPFGLSALKPMISKRTLQIHHGKHHAKYVNTLNALVAGTALENMSLEKIMKASYQKKQAIFNNAAQAWNHSFYWKCLSPKGGGVPHNNMKHETLAKKIDDSFGSYDEFRKQFADAANTAFGSGWAWLVSDKSGKLSVVKTIGADNPLTSSGRGSIPLLTCDVWEHAYYLDYANLRPSYVDTFLDKLVNWDFVAENLERAMNSGQAAEI